jgi:hypothetical protein
MGLNEYFDRTYVINLPERTDRRRGIEHELKKVGLALQPGKVEIFPAVRPSSAAGFPNIGHRGCFLSHYNVVKQARKEGLRNVLILEDDLAISPQLRPEAGSLVRQLEGSDWAFAYFGHVEKAEPGRPVSLRPHVGRLLTTHFLGINGTVFDALLRFLELVQQRPPGHPDGGPMSIDGAYSTFRSQHPGVLTLIAHPNLGWQRSSRSDLSPRWFDSWLALRPILGAMRSVKVWVKGR